MPGASHPIKVLLVEDDASLREGMVELVSEQADVREAASLDEAQRALTQERFSLVVTDLRIDQSGDGGKLILEGARKRLQPVAIVSAASHEDVLKVLRPHQPDAVLRKPFQLEDMVDLVERFVRLRRDVERLAAESAPPTAGWMPGAEGFSVCEASRGGQWWRLAPGARAPRPPSPAGTGVLLVEGSLEVDGERYRGPDYLYLAAGPRELSSSEGCLALSLALRS